MSIKLSEEIVSFINDKESIKVLATTDAEGTPHVVYKGSLHVNDAGQLEYYELIEASQTNKNMVHSIWFKKPVAINVLLNDKSVQIKGLPERVVIAGREFEEVYQRLRADGTDYDLSGIWRITPTEVRTETFSERFQTEDAAHPILRHLDRVTA